MGEQLSKHELFLIVTSLLQRFKLTFPEDQFIPDTSHAAFHRVPSFKIIAQARL